MDAEDIAWLAFKLLIGLFAFILLIAIFIYVPVMAVTENQCLYAGYPKARVSFTLSRFCVKRVNQTDIVVPLSKALEK